MSVSPTTSKLPQVSSRPRRRFKTSSKISPKITYYHKALAEVSETLKTKETESGQLSEDHCHLLQAYTRSLSTCTSEACQSKRTSDRRMEPLDTVLDGLLHSPIKSACDSFVSSFVYTCDMLRSRTRCRIVTAPFIGLEDRTKLHEDRFEDLP